jgi:signal transduction histidine kinase
VAVLIGVSMLALATHAVVLSLSAWHDRVFPGFMVLDNRVVASVGLFDWSGSGVEGLKQSQIVAVNGRPVSTAAEVYDAVAKVRPGTLVSYEIERDGRRREVSVAAERFRLRDWLILNGSFLLNGTVYLVAGLIVWSLRPRSDVAQAFLSLGLAFATLLFPAVALYRPSTYFRLHIVGETWLWAAALHLGLTFPYAHRWLRFAWVPYLLAAVVLVFYETHLYDASIYSHVVLFNYSAIGLAAIAFFVRLLWEATQDHSGLVRQRVRVLLTGTLVGFALPGAAIAVPAMLGGDVSMNLPSALNFVFALTLAYAIVQHDLFQIDAMVKRAAYYALLTGAVGLAYVAMVLVFNLVLRASAVTESPAFPVVFTLAVLLFFNPIRSRLQALVDRLFYRTRYDGAQVLADAGAALSSALTRDDIAAIVRSAVDGAIPGSGPRLWVETGSGALREVGGREQVPAPLLPHLAADRILTSFDAVEVYDDEATHREVRDALEHLAAEVAVPLRNRDDLVGVLTVGPKRSGLFYTAGDAEFLRALCHQAATALVNARTYEELVALNATLEQRVRDRTEELERSNGELEEALHELKNAEVQLVHAEKMASLGRLVAGIAHEINNPVSFISTSVEPLKRRLARVGEGAGSDTKRVLREATELVDIMARGADRTATIVKDLRTFSRLHEATRKEVDLNEGLEVSLRLLESHWRDRIRIHRDLGDLPLVECDPGQINQVFMNLLTNACDAIVDEGNLWITTRWDGEQVSVSIRDDGCGIPADAIGRIFDPFYTTKGVGEGTGLGLSISHGIVDAHGGRLEVQSAPGEGTTFSVILPVAAPSLDSAAGGR